MDWFTPELLWFLIGLVLIILEFGIPGVVTIFFGIGAWLVALLCLFFNIPLNLQIIVFIIGSIIPLILLRKWFKKMLEGRSDVGTVDLDELAEFLGKKVVVTEKITPEKKGRVEFRGSTWKAEAYENLAVGETVEIVDKNNITLIVKSL
jgi:inner membrane protein